MAGVTALLPDFLWRDEGERVTLCIGEFPVAKVEASGNGWVVRTLLHGTDVEDEPPSRISVPSLEQGKEWAVRWAQCRQLALVRARAHHRTKAGAQALGLA